MKEAKYNLISDLHFTQFFYKISRLKIHMQCYLFLSSYKIRKELIK